MPLARTVTPVLLDVMGRSAHLFNLQSTFDTLAGQ